MLFPKLIIVLAIGVLNQVFSFAQDSNALLFGTIANSVHDTLSLSNHYGENISFTDQNGQYQFKLNIENPEFFTFQINNQHFTLIILEGDTLELDFDRMDIHHTAEFRGEKAEINSQLMLMSNGAQAPDFSFADTEGDLLHLRDLKGKYVYIDVWNSACSPCFKEFPEIEELKNKYEGKDIVFVGISLDNNSERWRRTISRKKLTGIQLYGNGWDSEFVKNYHIWFNPRFILIDKEQKVVYLSSPRPSGGIDNILQLLPDL